MTDSKYSIPTADEYASYYQQYVGLVDADDFMAMFVGQIEELESLLGNLPDGEDEVLHEPYTWTLKQLVGHLIDVERIFSTRMLRIAVGDETPMPGMDQDIYVANLDYKSVSMRQLLDEFKHLRMANVLMAKRLPAEALGRFGTASDNPVSAKANLFILAGHVNYHNQIIRKRLG